MDDDTDSTNSLPAIGRAVTAFTIVLWSIIQYAVDGIIQWWLIYATHWIMLVVMVYLFYTVAILRYTPKPCSNTRQQPESEMALMTPPNEEGGDASPSVQTLPSPLTWRQIVCSDRVLLTESILRGIAFPGAVMISFLYWITAHDASVSIGLKLLALSEHSVMLLLMLTDMRSIRPTTDVRVMLLSFLTFSLIYTGWSLIFEKAHLHDEHGNPYIYAVVRWRENGPVTGAYAILLNALIGPATVFMCHGWSTYAKSKREDSKPASD